MTEIIVRRTGEEFAEWSAEQGRLEAARLEEAGLDASAAAASELGWVAALVRHQDQPINLEPFQVGFLASQSRFRDILKSRQVGWSYVIAMEMLARSHLRETHYAVCVSYTEDDAKDKIERVKLLHEQLPLQYQKRIMVDTKTEVSFASNGSKHRVSKIQSYAPRGPRGKSGDVYLDELAHCVNARSIYDAATSVITQSGGQISIGSTPLGQRGIFWEIHSEELGPYRNFWRQEVPWWLSTRFCNDMRTAGREAPAMPTLERVNRFGTAELLLQFGALSESTFQQEYEIAFQDERVSFFPLPLILRTCSTDRYALPVYETIEAVARNCKGELLAGLDVGRVKHPSELVILEREGATYRLRYRLSFRDVDFPSQRAILFEIVEKLGSLLRRFRIDQTGLGRNLTEDLQKKFGRRIEGVNFSVATKSSMAHDLKALMESQDLVLAADRDVVAQLRSIRQRYSAHGNPILDSTGEASKDQQAKHHADVVWALALAAWKPESKRRVVPAEVTIRSLRDHVPARPVVKVEEIKRRVGALYAEIAAKPETLRARIVALKKGQAVWARTGDEDKVRDYQAKIDGLMIDLGRTLMTRGPGKAPEKPAVALPALAG